LGRGKGSGRTGEGKGPPEENRYEDLRAIKGETKNKVGAERERVKFLQDGDGREPG